MDDSFRISCLTYPNQKTICCEDPSENPSTQLENPFRRNETISFANEYS